MLSSKGSLLLLLVLLFVLLSCRECIIGGKRLVDGGEMEDSNVPTDAPKYLVSEERGK